jgi:prolyl oligopeptidase
LLLYGYGSYGSTMSPYFSAHRRIWIEQGGIYAVANIRGGGAYGDAWHRAANLQNKKVTIDDFAACARHLVDHRYTSPELLAIQGGSAGGLMVYGVMVHHPQVARVVLAQVGISDVLRTELSPNGEFNITEFGTVADATQFRGMYAYSPYHHVADGTAYPALLATTGMNDPRVEPWQSFKMVARLQASGTPSPVLLRVSYTTGHGRGTRLTERDQQLADAYTFLFGVLGVPYEPVR